MADADLNLSVDILGMSTSAAQRAVEADGVNMVRPVSVDGEALVTTRDYRLDRINVALDRNGMICGVISRG